MSGTRALSLISATAVTLLLLIFPFALGPRLTSQEHAGLILLLLGVASAFVHGFGYVPDRLACRMLFNPLFAWPLILIGGLELVV